MVKVRRLPKKPLPIDLPNQLPKIPPLASDDHRRLQEFELSHGDEGRVVIRVGKNWVVVGDLRCCLGTEFLEDVLLNVAWKQISKELQSSSSPDGLKVGYFPSFFFTKLLQEGNHTEEGYDYEGVRTWSKTFLGDMSPPGL